MSLSGDGKDQLDYAWKWFAHHAQQRISMFNFFLVGIGILAAAYSTLLHDDRPDAAFAVAAS